LEVADDCAEVVGDVFSEEDDTTHFALLDQVE
jgi:hypothetical protein